MDVALQCGFNETVTASDIFIKAADPPPSPRQCGWILLHIQRLVSIKLDLFLLCQTSTAPLHTFSNQQQWKKNNKKAKRQMKNYFVLQFEMNARLDVNTNLHLKL